jgi:hypothetical protein
MFDTSNSKLKLMSNIELDFFRSQEGLLFDARRSAKFQNGGADRDRTGGLLVANQALSQLSYSPIPQFRVSCFQFRATFRNLKLETLN